MTPSRNTIFAALFARLSGAYVWKNTPSRRVKLWGEVDPVMRPALFQFEGGDETYTWSNTAEPKRTLPASIFIYTNAPEGTIGIVEQNDILDAIEAALRPTGPETALGRCTLGGLVYSCRINGQVFKDPGDLDGDGMLRIPIEIIVP